MNPYLEAARPKTLFNAIAPVIAGTGAGFATLVDPGAQAWGDAAHTLSTPGRVAMVGLCFIIAISATVAVNYANDLFDGLAGNDSPDRTGPRRAVASGLLTAKAMTRALLIALAVFIGSGLLLVWLIQSWWLMAVGVGCVLLLLAYSAGPFPLASHALGELAVFLTFGLAATMGTAFAISGYWFSGLFPAIGVGAFSCAVLEANNIRDIPEDERHAKRTLAVRLGDPMARLFYSGLLALPMVLSAWGLFHGLIPIPYEGNGIFIPHLGLALGLCATPWVLRGHRIVAQGAVGPNLIPVLAITGQGMTIWAFAGALGTLMVTALLP